MPKHTKIVAGVHFLCLALFVCGVSTLPIKGTERQANITPVTAHEAAPTQKKVVAQLADLIQAGPSRDELLTRTLTLTLKEPSAVSGSTVVINLREHAQWIDANEASVDPIAVMASIDHGEVPGLRLRQDAVLTNVAADKHDVLRGHASVVAKSGFDVTAKELAAQIAEALVENRTELTIEAIIVEPTLTLIDENGHAKTLSLLAAGYSDFANSTPGRLHNVHKSIKEHINNVVIPSGNVFSIVEALDAPITLEKGWKEDIGLFGGGTALTPGAGICQSATTVYRAALLAGLPIVEKRNHSLFVDHYEFYGIGLDATVFPRVHDLRFLNDTADSIVMQAYTDGDTAVVQLFGREDGRRTELMGPYFVGSKNRPDALGPLSQSQIGWARTVTYATGRTINEGITATYAKPLWRSLIEKYKDAEGITLLVPAPPAKSAE